MRLRAEADERVGSRADIQGSMIGIKLVDGKPTRRLAMTYFVQEKIPLGDLAPKRRIPKQLKVGKSIITTDVMVWPRMAEQSLGAAGITYDGNQQGTFTCFGRSAVGLFGVSCAHCLLGPDRNPATPTPVQMFSSDLNQYRPAGQSVVGIFSPGQGIPGSFGYMDCGLFSLGDPSLQNRGVRAAPIACLDKLPLLLGKAVSGRSYLNTGPTPMRTAVVIGINKAVLGEFADLVLQVVPPGTFHGDSGMLWRSPDGSAVGIHARGAVGPGGSLLVSAMAAHRAATMLGVTFAFG